MTDLLAAFRRRKFSAASLSLIALLSFCAGCAADLETPVKPADLSEKDKAIRDRLRNNPPPRKGAATEAK